MLEPCRECGKKFSEDDFIHRSFTNSTYNHYDSLCRSCRMKQNKKEEEYSDLHYKDYICRWCGKKYNKIDSFAKDKGRYCSKKCEYEDRN